MIFTKGFNPDDREGVIEIAEMSVTYSQPADTCDTGDSQFLKITAENCGSGEDGWFYRLSTERWSINEPSEIAEIIEDFINRMSINTTSEKEL